MSPSPALRLGLIGCGNISNAYFKGLKPFPHLAKITACSDIDLARAKAKAAEHGLAKGCSPGELLADDIDLVINLTIPAAHAEVNRQALTAGKHSSRPAQSLRPCRRTCLSERKF